MKSVSLKAFPRTGVKRLAVKKLRNQGRVPAVIYGRGTEPQNLELTTLDIENLIKHSVSENVLVDLAVEGDARPQRLALVQDVQHNALNGKVLHVDFHEVAENEKVTITVPVESDGEATGVKTGGGVLEHVLFKLKVRALPKDLPEILKVDVRKLEIGQSIHIRDMVPPEGVEILGNKDIVVLAVAAPLTEAQETAEEAAAATPGEVEMIKEKKEEGAPAGKTGEKGGDKGGEKAGEKAAKPGEKAADKGADKGGEKKAEKKK